MTAIFKQQIDAALNSAMLESVNEFATYRRTFTVTSPKGTGDTGATEEELQKILNKYYTADRIIDFNTKEAIDPSNCGIRLLLLSFQELYQNQR